MWYLKMAIWAAKVKEWFTKNVEVKDGKISFKLWSKKFGGADEEGKPDGK